jgi:potassium efflux system protein
VFVDGLTDGRILFNCFAHVPTARAAYAARSNVFMMLLSRFREEGVEVGTVPQKLELVAPPAAPERIDPSPPRS